jgi:long-chain fatty acid transport protein
MLTRRWLTKRSLILATTVVALVWAPDSIASAQATSQIPLQFNFMTPGARSLGMGGAFMGAADDATTASANPAGLASLSLREVSAEARYQRVETPFLFGGRISGTLSGLGLDTIAGPVYGTDVDDQGALAFLSLVVPLSHLTIAGYRHEVAKMENSFFAEGVFQRVTFGGVANDLARELPLEGTRDISISSYGGAVGLRLGPQLAIGGGLALYTFDLDSDFARLNFPSIFDPANRSAITATALQDGNDVALAPNVGVLWSPATGIKIGGQFRKGPRFEFSQTDDVPLNDVHVVREGRFKVPDVAGAGVEWRIKGRDDQAPEPGYALRILADYTRVQYSQLEEDFIDIQALTSGRPDQLHVDDANEIHGGVEVIVLRWRGRPIGKPIALRGGAWYDPDHAVRYEPTEAQDELDTLLSATLPGGKNLVHYTFGAGVALPHRIELNGAADFSSRTTYFTTSAVFRF